MVARLTRAQMIAYVENIMEPSEVSTEEEVDRQLDAVCMNCPDPIGAAEILIGEPPPPGVEVPETAEQLVALMLALPPRDPATLPESELPLDIPIAYRDSTLCPKHQTQLARVLEGVASLADDAGRLAPALRVLSRIDETAGLARGAQAAAGLGERAWLVALAEPLQFALYPAAP